MCALHLYTAYNRRLHPLPARVHTRQLTAAAGFDRPRLPSTHLSLIRSVVHSRWQPASSLPTSATVIGRRMGTRLRQLSETDSIACVAVGGLPKTCHTTCLCRVVLCAFAFVHQHFHALVSSPSPSLSSLPLASPPYSSRICLASLTLDEIILYYDCC